MLPMVSSRPSAPDLPRWLPRPIARRVAALGRDLGAVGALLRGQRPSPLVARRAAKAWPAPRAALPTRALEVTAVERPTDDAVLVHLRDPSGAPIAHRPGEFLTLLLEVDGRPLTRAYSIWTAPGAPEAAIAVKRVADGVASNHLNDTLAVGARLTARGPSGAFVVDPDPDRAARYVLLAGGSGITPLSSILEAVLVGEPRSSVTLVYGNRDADHVLLRERLDALHAAHPDRLVLRHVLDAPSDALPSGAGPLGAEALARELDTLELSDDPHTRWLICGPPPMMAAAAEVLDARGVPAERRLTERFQSPGQRLPAATRPQPVTVRLGGRDHALVAVAGQTLLEAGVVAGLPLPFSCTMGGCGACRLRLVSGEVAHDEPNCLTAEEQAGGLVLACVARALGPVTVEAAS